MIACVCIPYFATAVFCAGDEPACVVRYRKARGEVMAVNAAAEAAGIQPGVSASRARALCPAARMILAQPSVLRRAREKLIASLSQFSQYLHLVRSDAQSALITLDLGRLRPDAGEGMARQMIGVAAQIGYAASVGLAANVFTAKVAAMITEAGHVRLIHAARTVDFLAGQPAALLPASAETARRLALFGLAHIGQVAVLSRAALVAQFGREGARLHRLASGEDSTRIACYSPPEHTLFERSFDTPLEDGQLVRSILHAAAAMLMGPLAASGRSCGELVLTLRLDGGGELERIAHPHEPYASAAACGRGLLGLFDKMIVYAPVQAISVQAGAFAAVKPQQLSLFGDDPSENMADLLLRVSARYGESYFSTVVRQPATVPDLSFTLETIEAA
ncbi:MAG: hypothetical protein KME04_17820 [Pleurocapsa minor GSE-CHR-MK-17-07R]|jgi:protein ImuB|nr:hypothetical protein [Pleurocapsa minor GSE-CHR-MK 17-07R]